jgi:hypothetical protein
MEDQNKKNEKDEPKEDPPPTAAPEKRGRASD